MIKSLLSIAPVYSLFARIIGGSKVREMYLRKHIRAQAGFRVLDIGCGPGDILDHLPDVDYHGFDLSAEYIASAREKYGNRGRFEVHPVGLDLTPFYQDFDIALANGVIHHLTDSEAINLLRLASSALKPGGRLVTLDGCFVPEQSAAARFLLKQDRGKYVRTREAYLELAGQVFPSVTSTVYLKLLRIPYSHIVMEASKPS